MAKTRFQVAKQVRMASEAEAAMDLHVNKASEKIAHQVDKCTQNLNANQLAEDLHKNSNSRGICDDDNSTRATCFSCMAIASDAFASPLTDLRPAFRPFVGSGTKDPTGYFITWTASPRRLRRPLGVGAPVAWAAAGKPN
ncbi:hypothetical protein ACH5RR_000689 [Cinchona calisaya]|uniref:Uncharacterized protein n=1 Tax=Cinchona calisaya TaxID=153742 RepID=A0ABD3B1F7_9GENT